MIGIGFVVVMGLLVGFGLLGGIILFVGGYGMVIVWGLCFVEDYGVIGVVEIGVVIVIFGFIVVSFLGGLIGNYLIEWCGVKFDLNWFEEVLMIGIESDKEIDISVMYIGLMCFLFVLNIVIVLGVGL